MSIFLNFIPDSLPVSFLQNTFEPHVPQPLSKQERAVLEISSTWAVCGEQLFSLSTEIVLYPELQTGCCIFV